VANIASSDAKYNANAPIGVTQNMIFKPAFLVAYLCGHHRDALRCWGQKPPLFLGVGDTVSLGIEGLGEQRQKVVASRYGVQGCNTSVKSISSARSPEDAGPF
jgi:2-keto-4-pentenoate hydratase/2-oxohepta-3-ene-1,7-dioic acid hydratase in catechol pathway